MSNFDKARYADLISRCAFDMSAYRGTYQDQSSRRLAMTAGGTPGWGMVNGLPALRCNGATDWIASAAIAAIVDVTGAFFVEYMAATNVQGYDTTISHMGAGSVGGWRLMWNGANNLWDITSYDAAGVAARQLLTPVGSITRNKPVHAVFAYGTGGASGKAWVGGVPVTVSLVGAGVPAPFVGNRILYIGGTNAGIITSAIVRIWTGDCTNADAACLFGAAKSLVGEI